MRVIKYSLLFFVILILFLIGKTLLFSSKQISQPPIEKMAFSADVFEHLSESIRIPTISAPPLDTTVFNNFNTFLKHTFPLSDSLLEHKTINEYSHIYKWEGRDADLAPILLIAHLDVVPIEDEAAWKEPPFSGRINEQSIFGRGSLDDKLSVVGLLETCELLLSEQYTPNRSIYLAFGHDEEVGGQKGAKAIANYFSEENLEFEFILDEGSVVLEEAMKGLDTPAALIGVVEKGYITLELSVNLEEGGHSSMPPAETAISILSSAINKLTANPFPAKIDGATKLLFSHLGPELNFFNRLVLANQWLLKPVLKNILSKAPTTNAVIRTTTAPTVIAGGVASNVLPKQVSAKINFRIIPGENVTTVKNYVEDIINDSRISVNEQQGKFNSNPSSISPSDNFSFNVIKKTAFEVFDDIVVSPSLVIAATDARHYEDLSESIYRFLPIKITKQDLKGIHGKNEELSKENYLQLLRFYRQLIFNSCK